MASSASPPFTCEYSLPDPTASAKEVLSRWSDSRLDRPPAAVVHPRTEADVAEALRWAQARGLRVVPAGGGHGTFLPIDARTLYLDMRLFNEVRLDKDAGTVRVGGGAVVGELVKATTAEGWYAAWPNSNAVGVVGAVLGGGANIMNGLRSFMIDNVVSFRLVTAKGKALELSAASADEEERALFFALCGAGHGMGVVTSITLKAFPLADLGMPENNIWVRRLMFSPAGLEAAAEAFASFPTPLPERLLLTMVYVRMPPPSGAPMIMLTASFYGPPEEAEKAVAPLLDPALAAKAVKAETLSAPFARATDAFDAANAHHGYKDISTAFLRGIDVATIKAGFDAWLNFTNAHPDAAPTLTIFGRWSTERLEAEGRTPEGRRKFFESRDRGVACYAFRWCGAETEAASERYSDEFLRICRSGRPEGEQARSWANNMRYGMDLREMHTEEAIAELRRIKKLWDPEGLFWSPYGGEATVVQ